MSIHVPLEKGARHLMAAARLGTGYHCGVCRTLVTKQFQLESGHKVTAFDWTRILAFDVIHSIMLHHVDSCFEQLTTFGTGQVDVTVRLLHVIGDTKTN